LEKEDLNPRALSLAAECSVQSGNIDQACALLSTMKKKGLPIRQHYFWPLLASHRDNADGKLHLLLSYLYLLWKNRTSLRWFGLQDEANKNC
jgi:leucine-rich PPR motif-containing protein